MGRGAGGRKQCEGVGTGQKVDDVAEIASDWLMSGGSSAIGLYHS